MELMVESEIVCPHCGEPFALILDTSLPEQSIIEDCTVCCRPIALSVRSRPGEILDLQTG
jgi:cysteine-rich CPXCG protein